RLEGATMRPNPKRMADVIRMPVAQGGPAPAAATAAVARPEVESTEVHELAADLPSVEETATPAANAASNRDKIDSRIEAWHAPVLPDEIVDTLATIFLMQPGHELMPFFLWLDGKVK
ncbi:MAG: hypothetical protein ACREQQ_02525, partial [Candidatus Binatia bacterium]